MTILSIAHRQVLVVLAAMTAAIPALAEERPEPPATAESSPSTRASRPLRLAISGIMPGSDVRVVPQSDNGERATSCWQDCELTLRKGTYTLISSRGDDTRVKEIDLASSQILNVGRWDGTVRTMGTVLGITGVTLAALGTLVMTALMLQPSPGPDDDPAPGAEAVPMVGVLGILAGTGLAVGGFSMAAHNRAPSMDLERMPTPYPPPARATGVSLSGKF